jgi:hypothetical protein
MSHVHHSNCGSCIPKTIATLPKATYDEETGHTTCTCKIREALPLKRLPISYSFGVFDGYDATVASSWVLSDADDFLLQQDDSPRGPCCI